LADTTCADLGVGGALVVWMDAERGEVFSACYLLDLSSSDARRCEPVAPALVGSPATILEALPFAASDRVTFVGDGAVRHAAVIHAVRGSAADILTNIPPLAPAIARLGRAMAATGAAGPPHALAPLYIRRPDAELDRDRPGRT
jgi:tRNA A37 threonylcarbamoyladenosine modification protein TsaB